KKVVFSEEDLSYRLRQHGLPIGKETILPPIKSLFAQDPLAEPAKHLILLSGSPGLGASYCAEEIKAMVQLLGLPCYLSNREQQVVPPQKFPFVWILDDLASYCLEPRTQELPLRLKSLFSEASAECWWIVLTGLDPEQLPSELQALLQ